MMKFVCCFVVCFALVNMVASRKLPGYVQVCKVTDPAYDACVLKSVEALRPRLAKGISKLSVPPLEPFSVPLIELSQDTQILKANVRWTDNRFHGGSHFQVEAFKIDPIGLTLELTILLPVLTTQGTYEFDGKVLQVHYKDKGIYRSNFTNIRVDVLLKGKFGTIDGEKRASVADMKIKMRILGESDVHIENLTGDTKSSGFTDWATTFLNQNQKQLYEIIYPLVDEAAVIVFTPLLNAIGERLDVDEVFPSK